MSGQDPVGDWSRLDDSPAASAQMVQWYAPQTAAVLEDVANRKYAAMEERHLNSCIWIDPGRQSGQPCFGGTRVPAVPFMAIVDEAGDKAAQALWPSVTDAHIEAGRAFMALLSTNSNAAALE